MTKGNLYIPKKIHVGFRNRSDTYTGKLAYVIYEDEKGVLRKKASWKSWIDSNIKQVVFNNEPSRFVFNKGVQRQGFGSNRSLMRVYDNRDFEFEISIENLVGILMHSDISKRDILEECVFAWSGKDLILLPVNSEEYRTSLEFTSKQNLKFSAKDLVKGYVYEKKKSNGHLMYMGYENFYDRSNDGSHLYYGKKHIFYDLQIEKFVTPNISIIAKPILEEVNQNFAKINDKLYDSYHLTEMVDADVEMMDIFSNNSYCKKMDGSIFKIIYNTCCGRENRVIPENCYFLKISFEKKEKGLIFNDVKLRINTDAEELEKFFKLMDVDWKICKEVKGSYPYICIKGSSYSMSEFERKMKHADFGNSIKVIDVNKKNIGFKF